MIGAPSTTSSIGPTAALSAIVQWRASPATNRFEPVEQRHQLYILPRSNALASGPP